MLYHNKSLDFLPLFLRNIKEFIYLTNLYDEITEKIINDLNELEKNLNIKTADEKVIKYWEDIFDIKSKYNDSIQIKRERVINRFKEQIPFTQNYILDYLDLNFGKGNFIFKIDYQTYYIRVHIPYEKEEKLETTKQFLERILPCNLVLDLNLMYTTHNELNKYTHAYLNKFTNKKIKEEGKYFERDRLYRNLSSRGI